MWAWVYRSLIDKYKFRQYWPQIPRGMWNTDRIRPWKKASHHAMVNWVQSVRSCWYVLCYKDVSDHGYCMSLTMVDTPIIFICTRPKLDCRGMTSPGEFRNSRSPLAWRGWDCPPANHPTKPPSHNTKSFHKCKNDFPTYQNNCPTCQNNLLLSIKTSDVGFTGSLCLVQKWFIVVILSIWFIYCHYSFYIRQ